MTNKQVKKLIVEKASLVVVPNVTDKIRSRLNEIPPKPQAKPIFRLRRLVEVMAFSMVILIVATLSILYASRETDPFLTAEADDTLYEAVMLSSISTVSIIDDEISTLSSDNHIILLANGPHNDTNDEEDPDEETTITNDVDDVRRYLRLMESILASEQTYRYQRQVINRRQRRYALEFTTDSLTDEQIDYELIYEVIEDTKNETTLTATITKDGTTYQPQITYHKENQSITMKTNYLTDQSIEVSFNHDDEGRHYQISRYDGLTLVEYVDMHYQTRAGIQLSLIQGNSFNTYDFTVTTGPLGHRRMLSIDYDIQNQYQGNILISITGHADDTYSMIITPNGRPSFVITRERGNNGRNQEN